MAWKCPFFLLALMVVPACTGDVLSPNDAVPSQIESDGLVMRLSVDRAEIRPDEEFIATYSIRNTRSAPIQLKSLCSEIARGVVYHDGAEVALIGSGSGCRPAIGSHEIAGGETAVWQWTVRGAVILRAYPDGREPDVALAEAGEYVFRVEPDVFRLGESDLQLPRLEERVIVR